MNRVRTLIAAALLTVPMLSLSAADAVDHSTSVVRDSALPSSQAGYTCFWIAGHWYCF